MYRLCNCDKGFSASFYKITFQKFSFSVYKNLTFVAQFIHLSTQIMLSLHH